MMYLLMILELFVGTYDAASRRLPKKHLLADFSEL